MEIQLMFKVLAISLIESFKLFCLPYKYIFAPIIVKLLCPVFKEPFIFSLITEYFVKVYQLKHNVIR